MHLNLMAPMFPQLDVNIPEGWWKQDAQLDLDFANKRAYNKFTQFRGRPDSILTYTSPSPKMVYDVDGVLRYAPHNLLPYSEQFDNAAWTPTSTTLTANAATAPNGTTTADRLIEATFTGSHVMLPSSPPSVVSGTAYTGSVYLKKGIGATVPDWVQLTFQATGFGAAQYANFNLNTGAVGAVSGATSSIQSVGNGWYRCSITATASASTTAGLAIVFTNNADAARTPAYAGAVTSDVYLWGAQLNLGSSALTYIPTTSAAVYALPIDHDPITHAPLGVLIEEQRTNLLTYSEQFDNAAWTKSQSSITANAAVAPDGTTTADKLVENSLNNTHSVQQSQTIASATAYTLSVYAKAAGRSEIQLQFFDGTTNKYPVFSLINGSKVIDNGIGTAWKATQLPDDWWRFEIVATSAGTTAQCYIYPAITGVTSYLGDGTSGIYIWGMQLEAGVFPTSYIPTVASQVTRAADRISIAQSGYAFNANAGTFVAEYDLIGYVENYRVVSGGPAYRYFYGPGTVTTLSSYNGSATVTTTVVSPVGSATKVAMSYDGNGRSITDNGDAISGSMTDANVFLIASTTTAIGADPDGSSPLNGHIKRLTYWNTRKPNAELQGLSA